MWINRGDNISLSVNPGAAAVFNNISSFYASVFPQTKNISTMEEFSTDSGYNAGDNEFSNIKSMTEIDNPVVVTLDWVHRTETKNTTLLSCYYSDCILSLFVFNNDNEGTYELLISRKFYFPSENTQSFSVIIARVTIHTSGT